MCQRKEKTDGNRKVKMEMEEYFCNLFSTVTAVQFHSIQSRDLQRGIPISTTYIRSAEDNAGGILPGEGGETPNDFTAFRTSEVHGF